MTHEIICASGLPLTCPAYTPPPIILNLYLGTKIAWDRFVWCPCDNFHIPVRIGILDGNPIYGVWHVRPCPAPFIKVLGGLRRAEVGQGRAGGGRAGPLRVANDQHTFLTQFSGLSNDRGPPLPPPLGTPGADSHRHPFHNTHTKKENKNTRGFLHKEGAHNTHNMPGKHNNGMVGVGGVRQGKWQIFSVTNSNNQLIWQTQRKEDQWRIILPQHMKDGVKDKTLFSHIVAQRHSNSRVP